MNGRLYVSHVIFHADKEVLKQLFQNTFNEMNCAWFDP